MLSLAVSLTLPHLLFHVQIAALSVQLPVYNLHAFAVLCVCFFCSVFVSFLCALVCSSIIGFNFSSVHLRAVQVVLQLCYAWPMLWCGGFTCNSYAWSIFCVFLCVCVLEPWEQQVSRFWFLLTGCNTFVFKFIFTSVCSGAWSVRLNLPCTETCRFELVFSL